MTHSNPVHETDDPKATVGATDRPLTAMNDPTSEKAGDRKPNSNPSEAGRQVSLTMFAFVPATELRTGDSDESEYSSEEGSK